MVHYTECIVDFAAASLTMHRQSQQVMGQEGQGGAPPPLQGRPRSTGFSSQKLFCNSGDR